MQQRSQPFGLIDGAANPARLLPLLEQSGTQFVSIYEGLPEDQLGPASLFLASIDDPGAAWVSELDQIDLHSPCLTLVWSPVGLGELAIHLRAFLFTEIGDGMTAMVRFFDPRNTGAVLDMWGDQIRNVFLAPIERLKYRGRHEQWQTVENDSLNLGRISRSVMIELDQNDIDALTAHTEPDELMASLIELGHIDGTTPYRSRFLDFEPRYRRALEWGFVEPRDRLAYCDYSYRYGAGFDQHSYIRDALTSRRRTGGSFDAVVDRIPASVWNDLKRSSEA
ncbi:DUF4123 domain-containing protein [Burkholderia vietnamiensis]|uniref:DUF4123 domain-containing protein n=1 Tax=Burkholderia vietnamiensis TaxID=60552 RepID=UPI00075424DB|nr:DUF4123 domain-containing protein [Burkholderia vietnamiensis]KVF02448.1 hypothetical protein WJ03_04660 [Burkholderia vietnamiensis]